MHNIMHCTYITHVCVSEQAVGWYALGQWDWLWKMSLLRGIEDDRQALSSIEALLNVIQIIALCANDSLQRWNKSSILYAKLVIFYTMVHI